MKHPELTKNELAHIRVILLEHRQIQSIIGKKQDKEYASIMNKLTNYFRSLEGKEPI